MIRNGKIYIIFHGRFPSEKAASLFAAKSAETFAALNNEVVLLVPKRLGRSMKQPSEFYKVMNNFQVTYLPTLDLYNVFFIKKIAYYISFIFFSLAVFYFLHKNATADDIIYSNDSLPLWLANYKFSNTYYEMHDFPEKKNIFYKSLFKKVKGVIVTNKWKLAQLQHHYNFSPAKIQYEPNAVDIREFDIDIDKPTAREKLHLPQDKHLVIYTGHLYSWKGVDTLAQASKYLSKDVLVIFVGGTQEDLKQFKVRYGTVNNIQLVGFRPHEEMPLWQKAADVLVIPNTAREDISKYYTSPMKLFEYMASRRPIVASDIPSIAEVIDETCAYLVQPDNPRVLADTILRVLANLEKSESIIALAFERVEKYSWMKRGQRILDFIYG